MKELSEINVCGELFEFLFEKALMYFQTVVIGVFIFNEKQNLRKTSFFFFGKKFC